MTQRLRPDDVILNLGGRTLGDFWSWAYSDFTSSHSQAMFARFLVSAALDALDTPYADLEGYHLLYRGRKIAVEVAVAEADASPIFDIAERKSPDLVSASYVPQPIRPAEAYVFCRYAGLTVLDAADWEFCVLLTDSINRHFRRQQTADWEVLRQLGPPVAHNSLRAALDQALDKLPPDRT
jgi:hypothetical protein